MWSDVDSYFSDLFIPADPALDAALDASDAAGLPTMQVAPNQGKLLMLLAQIQQAQTILEIGTLGGYSTIWMARALPVDGRLVTLEANPDHADVARSNIDQAGLMARVQIHVGPALETLPDLEGPFDMVFIDADKENTDRYFAWALRLARPGTLIVVDNIVRDGAVIDADTNDPGVQGIRRFSEAVAAEPRASAVAIQTVGSKGYDGFALVRVE